MRCIIFAQDPARFKCARRATAAAQDFRADSYLGAPQQVQVKGRGVMTTYQLVGRKPLPAA